MLKSVASVDRISFVECVFIYFMLSIHVLFLCKLNHNPLFVCSSVYCFLFSLFILPLLLLLAFFLILDLLHFPDISGLDMDIYDLWCGDSPLKEFPELFLISRDRDSSIADLLQFNNGVKHWVLHFSRSVQDWELDSLGGFMDLIYSSSMLGKRDDKMCWKPNKSRGFEVLGYYRHLYPSNSIHFPWKSMIPPRVAFFSWSAVLGRILTRDNLFRRGISMIDGDVMCKHNGEDVDHLLLHCPIVSKMWSLVFCLFGIHWVMPLRVMDLLVSWQGSFGRYCNAAIWKIVPYCLMWCMWWEKNARSFEDREWSILELKSSSCSSFFFFFSFLDSVIALQALSCDSFSDFLELCSVRH